jgi:hypothetical protein
LTNTVKSGLIEAVNHPKGETFVDSQPLSNLTVGLELIGIFFFWLYFKSIDGESRLRYWVLVLSILPGALAGYGVAVLLHSPESFLDISLLEGKPWQAVVLLVMTRVAVLMLLLVLVDICAKIFRKSAH